MIDVASLFALWFVDLSLLGWLAAAAAPVLIHLWQKRRKRTMTWAAMQFLVAAKQKQSRRLRIDQWLLLLLRVMIVAGIVLAAAGPYISRSNALFSSSDPIHRVILLDVSYSMGTREADHTRLDIAKERIAELVKSAPAGSGFTLITMGSTANTVIGEPALDRTQFLRLVDGVELSHGGANILASLNSAMLIMQKAKQSSHFSQQVITVATDLGENSWQALDTDAGKETLKRIAELQATGSAAVQLLEIGSMSTDHIVIDSLQIQSGLLTTARPINCEAIITNHDKQSRRVPLEFLVDGERQQQWLIDAPGNGRQTTHTWSFNLDKPGEHSLELRTSGDLLEMDNHRYAVVKLRKQIRSLIVNGDAEPRSANYLRFAIDPDAGLPERTSEDLLVDIAGEADWQNGKLNDYQIIWFNNVAQFVANEAQFLREYHGEGGNIVWWLGPRSQADSYNRALTAADASTNVLDPTKTPAKLKPLLPAKLLKPSDIAKFSLNPLDYKHPIVKEFAGHERAGLLQTPLARYMKMQVIERDSMPLGQTALAIRETNDPGIVVGTGQTAGTVVVAWPASLSSDPTAGGKPWTVMPALQSFQPIVQEIMLHTLSQRSREQIVLVDQSFFSSDSPATDFTKVQIISPTSREPVSERNLTASNDVFRATRSGFYRFSGDAAESSALMAANVDTTESNLRKTAINALPSSWIVTSFAEGASGTPNNSLGSVGLQQFLLIAVLILAVAENFVAWSLGRGTA